MTNSSPSGLDESLESPIQGSSDGSTVVEEVSMVEEDDEEAVSDEQQSDEEDEGRGEHYGLEEFHGLIPEDEHVLTLDKLKNRWRCARKEAMKLKMAYMARLYVLAHRMTDRRYIDRLQFRRDQEARDQEE